MAGGEHAASGAGQPATGDDEPGHGEHAGAAEGDGAKGHGTKAIFAAFFANLGIAILKFIGFVITGSGSMLAEGVHSVADTGNQFLLLLGNRKAQRRPDRDRPFGYGRERFFWAFVVSLVLFTVGALFSIVDGVEKLIHPHEIDNLAVAIGILLGGVLLEGYSFRTAILHSRLIKRQATWWQFIRRAKNPELPVVLLEDLAALAGLTIALIAIVMSQVTGNPDWDAVGTLAIGGLLGVVAIVLSVEMRSLLIGESATPEVQARIAAAIERQPDVHRIIHLRTEHLGPEEILVAAKVEFDPDLSIRELADVINVAEAAVRADVAQATMIFLEPDVFRPGVEDGAVGSREAAPHASS
jgi:cation diffusion facilitator family transporter